MSDYPFFYNSVSGDRVYDADSFSDWLKKFFTTGVFIGDLQVTANNDMTVTVGSGYVNIGGKVMMWEAPSTLDVTTAHATYNRIDTVVVERNDTDRDFYLKVVKGSATGTPAATEPTRSGAVYQLVLAQINVAAGATAISQADVTDMRADTDVCGFVAATVKEIDFSQIQAQYDSFIANYRTAVAADYKNYTDKLADDHAGFQAEIADYEGREKELYQSWQDTMEAYQKSAQSDFDTWFDSIKGALSEDAAGNLQNQISEINDAEATEEEVKTMVDEMYEEA